MKHLIIILAAMVAALSSGATNSYPTLLFKTNDGIDHLISTSGLEISFDSGNLNARAGAETLSFPVANVLSMQFSTSESGLEEILTNADGVVSIYSLDGILRGSFSSLPDASALLPEGIYIVRYADGTTSKIMLKK